MRKAIYINGFACIAPQPVFGLQSFPEVMQVFPGNDLRATDPDYKKYVNPVAIRRMSRVVKMGLSCAKETLNMAQIEKPDAIIMGTGLGCMEDTEKFLQVIIDEDEKVSAPTPFISSTHNSVAAQIGLHLKCLGYNFTYVHKGFSLHSALLDASMQIELDQAKHVLAGGIDENTESKFRHYGLIGWWKNDIPSNKELYSLSDSPGTISGEGAACFLLSSEKAAHSHVQLLATHSVFNKPDIQHLENELVDLLHANNLRIEDIDLFISGFSGDSTESETYSYFENIMSENTHIARFKHLSGTFYTSDIFAVWMACIALETQKIPDYTLLKKGNSTGFKHVLIYNANQQLSHVFHLLKYVD